MRSTFAAMMRTRFYTSLIAPLLMASVAGAQASPTATRPFDLSVWLGLTGTYTGLSVAPGVGQGKNLGLTLGGDITLRRYFGVNPAVEIRATDPVFQRRTDGQKSVLAGLKIGRRYSRLEPYVDFLIGRGQIDYINNFYSPDGTVRYIQSVSTVLSPGVGVDVRVTDRFLLKLDGQFQRWDTPVTTSGHLYAKPLTAAIVYRPRFGR